MKKCCKQQVNWKHNGTRDKKVEDLGKAVNISAKSYIECHVCGNKMFLKQDKTLVDAPEKSKA